MGSTIINFNIFAINTNNMTDVEMKETKKVQSKEEVKVEEPQDSFYGKYLRLSNRK